MTINSISLALILTTVLACHGRHDDFSGSRDNFHSEELGLVSNQSSIVVFGAAWCVPCRHEIKYFNKVEEAYGGNVIVKTFLVEGVVPGEDPTQADLNGFSYKGEQNFEIDADPDWKRFKLFQEEKRLPLILFVSKTGEVTHVHNRNIKDTDELFSLIDQYLGVKPSSAVATPKKVEDEEPTLVEDPADTPSNVDTPDTPQQDDCSPATLVAKPLPMAYPKWEEDQCEVLLTKIKAAYDGFFLSEDGEFLEKDDYPLDKGEVRKLSSDPKPSIDVYWEKHKYQGDLHLLCTLRLILATDGSSKMADSTCVIIQD